LPGGASGSACSSPFASTAVCRASTRVRETYSMSQLGRMSRLGLLAAAHQSHVAVTDDVSGSRRLNGVLRRRGTPDDRSRMDRSRSTSSTGRGGITRNAPWRWSWPHSSWAHPWLASDRWSRCAPSPGTSQRGGGETPLARPRGSRGRDGVRRGDARGGGSGRRRDPREAVIIRSTPMLQASG